MAWMQQTRSHCLSAVQAKNTLAVHLTFLEQNGCLRPAKTSEPSCKYHAVCLDAGAQCLNPRTLLCRRQDSLVQLSEIRVEPLSRDQAIDRKDASPDQPLKDITISRKASVARR